MYSGCLEMTKLSHKKKLGGDARIIVALMKKQPQTKVELCKRIPRSTVFSCIPVLEDNEIIHKFEKGYALFDYKDLEEIFANLRQRGVHGKVSIYDLANKVGRPPDKIESEAFRLGRKYGYEITFDRTVIGKNLKKLWE